MQIRPPGDEWEGTVQYTFNQRNLLTAYDVHDGTDWVTLTEYAYDGNGDRVQQVVYDNSTPITTNYTNDPQGLTQMLVSETDGDATYNIFGQGLIASETAGGTYFSLADGLGSVRIELVDGVVTNISTYSPYGKLIAQIGWFGTAYGYAGEQYDQMTQLVYLRARYYNPSLKVFISADPFPGFAFLPQTQHAYTYVGNNPINMTDPSGRIAPILLYMGAGAAVGAGIGAVAGGLTYILAHPGGSAEDYLNDGEFWKSVGRGALTGAVSGAFGGAVGWLLPATTSGAAAVGFGVMEGVLSGALEQLVLNAITPCRELTDDLAEAAIIGGVTGGLVSGGAFQARQIFDDLARRSGISSLFMRTAVDGVPAGSRLPGASWIRIDERVQSNIVRQAFPDSCSSACAQMLLNRQGLTGITESAIVDLAGRPASVESIAKALNILDNSSGTWIGIGFPDDVSTVYALTNNGAWIANLLPAGQSLQHSVIVEGYDNFGRLIISDPAQGTRYLMGIDDFMSWWGGFGVYEQK